MSWGYFFELTVACDPDAFERACARHADPLPPGLFDADMAPYFHPPAATLGEILAYPDLARAGRRERTTEAGRTRLTLVALLDRSQLAMGGALVLFLDAIHAEGGDGSMIIAFDGTAPHPGWTIDYGTKRKPGLRAKALSYDKAWSHCDRLGALAAGS